MSDRRTGRTTRSAPRAAPPSVPIAARNGFDAGGVTTPRTRTGDVWMVTAESVDGHHRRGRLPAGLGAALPSLPGHLRRTVTQPVPTGGVADECLWSALHGDRLATGRRVGRWDEYRERQSDVAATVESTCGPGDIAWVHDYPLMLAPAEIRSRRPDLTIGFSFHCAFECATMAWLEHAPEIAASLRACDLIGVQTVADAVQLDAFFADAGTAEWPPVTVSPTSIDPVRVATAARDAATAPAVRHLAARAGARRLIVSVDDLDHTSAISERLTAYDLAFRDGVLDPDDVHIVQIVSQPEFERSPTRALRVEIERIVHALNAAWTGSDRAGVVDVDVELDTSDRSHALAALRLADIAVVTPARAGTSIQAKEFAVLAEATGGVLILSDRSGAAAELGQQSMLVDGSDPTSIVDGLRRAVRLDGSERRRVAVERAARVHRWTAADWASHFLRRLVDAGERSARDRVSGSNRLRP